SRSACRHQRPAPRTTQVLSDSWLLGLPDFFVGDEEEGFVFLDHAQLGAGTFFYRIEPLLEVFDFCPQPLVTFFQQVIFGFLTFDGAVELPDFGETAFTDPEAQLQAEEYDDEYPEQDARKSKPVLWGLLFGHGSAGNAILLFVRISIGVWTGCVKYGGIWHGGVKPLCQTCVQSPGMLCSGGYRPYFRPLNSALPRYGALSPMTSSMRSSWLYLATRSERHREPVLIWPAAVATARSAMVESSVSPERCEITAV